MNEVIYGLMQVVATLFCVVVVFYGSAAFAAVWVNAFRSLLKPTTSNANVNWNPKVTLVPAEPDLKGKGPDAR